ncbi:hypothetical protein F8568_023295 [Actinomadura sp. LD22]|uniref:Uncharacterized protein n=1 Tax=Actinomadura physcomitrii TaxID=2650748 RepID=A0A6I4MKL3_9ACTN|nr:hypothetical protein [Actinomadura physcomitrii]MWA03249.1 hypothetical protein [Actinomadura physcomitrii]
MRWLSTAIVDAANHGRPNTSGIKVGGHQASSASMVEIMTSLWFSELTEWSGGPDPDPPSPVLFGAVMLLHAGASATVPSTRWWTTSAR